jgi:hypothetical protein
MRPLPSAHKIQINKDVRFKICARSGGDCSGRITIEHAFLYGGKQVNEMWAYVPICWYHHLGAGLNKEINRLLALRHATDDDLKKYPKTDWLQMKKYLESKYGQTKIHG